MTFANFYDLLYYYIFYDFKMPSIVQNGVYKEMFTTQTFVICIIHKNYENIQQWIFEAIQYTAVQITHNLNGTHVHAERAKPKNMRGIKPRVCTLYTRVK